MAAAGARQLRARDLVAHVVLRHQHAGDGDLAAADVGVRVDAAGHDDAAVEVIFRDRPARWSRRHDAAVADVDVANLAVDAVAGIVDLAAGQLDEHSYVS